MPTEPFAGNETESPPVAPETPGQVPVQATTEPGYITANQLNEALSNFGKTLDDKFSNLYRGIQSQNDKLQDRVQKKMEAYEQAAKAQGITLTPTQRQRLVDDTTIAELQSASNPSPSQPIPDQGKQRGESEDEFVNRVNLAAETMLKVAGITLDDNDPELDLINKASEGSAEQYLEAHREAIRLKKERLASGGKETPQRASVGGVPGAISGSPNSNPIANIMDKDQLWDMAKKQGKIK